MIKEYLTQWNKKKQYNKKRERYELHNSVTTSLPISFLNEIGIDKDNRKITIELDKEHNQLIIKKGIM